MKKIITLMTVLALLLSVCVPALPSAAADAPLAAVKVEAAQPAYKDESNSYAERALDLVSRMTLAEKASQTAGYNAAAIPRLGISSYMWWNEALHGYSQEGWFGAQTDGASYPSSYSMGASWDPDIYYQEATEIGAEIRERVKGNRYNLTMFSPTINLSRDPRWGRNDEGYSEDPLLTGLMGASFVNGVEGKNQDGTYKITNANGEGMKQAVTTIKHYAANNSEKNRYTSGADNVTPREMREYYTRAARIVVDKADVSSVMMAYSSVSGIPISFSSYYMDTVLRQSYGFSGYIVSDCDSVATSYNRNIHKTNPHTGKNYTLGEAFANAMANGLDLQCNAGETDGLGSYAANIHAMLGEDGKTILTDKGAFTEQQLEVSTARLMTKRMQLGEFDVDNKYADIGAAGLAAGKEGAYIAGALGQTQKRIDLADELSRSTIVLLKNEKKALPITEAEIKAAEGYDVAIIGPVGQSNFRGGYSSRSSNESNLVTIEQAIKTAFADTDTYAQATIDNVNIAYHYGFSSAVSRSRFTTLKTEDIALGEVAEGLDLAIVVVGQGSGDSREDGDRTDLHLSQPQIELIKQVKAKNPKKLILVMETYGPVLMSDDIVGNADAILWSCFNGFRKGTGFGEAITGKNNPSGRTNATWLADCINDIPGFFDYSLFSSNGEGGRTYMYNVEDTIYPFGFGLSYSEVEYAPKAASGSILGADKKDGLVLGGANDPITKDTVVNVSFNITNTNNLEGKQVAEVYVVSPGAGTNNLPFKRLVGFDKVNVAANGTTEVNIPINASDFGFFNEEKDCYELPTGEWQIWVARSSDFNAETDLMEKFTVADGSIREDPAIVTVKPTQIGDDKEGITERVIFNLSADASQNIILPGVAVTMSNEKLYGTRVINNVPGEDIGVSPDAVNEYTNSTEEKFTVPDTAANVERLDTGKSADELPKVGEKFILPASYKVTYASNHPNVVKAGSATKAGEFAEGQLVMKSAGVATITVKVTAPSGEFETTDFAVCVKAAPALANMRIGGKAFEAFDPSINAYTVTVPAGADTSKLAVAATGIAGTKVEYSADGTEYAAMRIAPATLPSTIYVKVSGADVAEQVYTVKFTGQFSSAYFIGGEIDDQWTIVNEDAAAYEAIKGLGLRLPMQTATFAANAEWKNLFTRPIGGDWTMVTKLSFPDGFSKSGQQILFMEYEDLSNMIKGTLSVGGSGASASISFAMAPTIGGASNGSIRATTTLQPTEDPSVIYVKIKHEKMRFDIWYSADGVNYTKVQSADGRRTGEAQYLPDAVFAMYVSGGTSNTADQGVICEYMDITTMDGVEIKSEQAVLNDAFKAVCDYAATIVPETIDKDLSLTLPLDYTVTYVADDCIARDGTVFAPAADKKVNLKVIVSHPNAKVGGASAVTVFDGPVTVKGSGAGEEDYALGNSVLNFMVGNTAALPVTFNGEKVMSAAVDVADSAIVSASPERLEAPGAFTLKGLKKGATDVVVTFYGLPNNVELGTLTLKAYVGGAEMFDDIVEGPWYFEGVDYMTEKGFMNGTGNNLFKPDSTLTRAQLVTILYRLAGEPAVQYKSSFSDVPNGKFYSKAVTWAAENKIVEGYSDGTFKPDRGITREQIATILYRYKGQPKVEGDLSAYPDAASVGNYARDAMTWAVAEGLINGVKSSDATRLMPQRSATRAQIATIIMRLLLAEEAVRPEPAR